MPSAFQILTKGNFVSKSLCVQGRNQTGYVQSFTVNGEASSPIDNLFMEASA